MRILVLLLFPFLLFSAEYCVDNNNGVFNCFYFLSTAKMGKDTSEKCTLYYTNPVTVFDANSYYYDVKENFSGVSKYFPYGLNIPCFIHYVRTAPTWGGCSNIHTADVAFSYCKLRKGYQFSTIDYLWHSESNSSVLCPAGDLYDPTTHTCKQPPKCNLKCISPKILNNKVCQCVCPAPMLTDKLGHCIPNPNLNKEECEKEGGIYMDNNILDTFSSINNAIASLYAPPGEHYCYSLSWVEAKKEALKAKVSPKNVLFTALSFLPLGKLGKLAKWLGIGDKIIEEAKSPKMLQDNRAVIDTKYNPQTGTYEPVIELKPRDNPLPENQLFQNPSSLEEGENIVKPTKNLDDFLRSKFAEVDFDNPSELDQAVISYDLDTGLRQGTQTKIAEDLRDIFKKSEISSSSQSFPVTLKDYVGDEGSVQTEVTREITPIETQEQTKIYNIKYKIVPQGASTPVIVQYHAEVSPEPNSKENLIKITPLYQISKTTITGQPFNLKTTSDTINQDVAKDQPQNPDFTTFKSPAENAIKQAFNYKITLFTCPNVSPNCPHNVKINYNLAGIKGEYIIPDPMCTVISTINNPHVSPAVDKAGDLIVLFAGIFGFLTLFRRD